MTSPDNETDPAPQTDENATAEQPGDSTDSTDVAPSLDPKQTQADPQTHLSGPPEGK